MLVLPITFLWLCSIAVAAPTTDSSHTALQQRDGLPNCYPIEQLDTVYLNPNDCLQALVDMPVTATTRGSINAVAGDFGNMVAAGSPFKLPRHFANGNCMIGVTMAAASLARTDRSSWNEIAAQAAGIIITCVNPPPPARRGGTITVGRGNQINVEIFMNSPHVAFLVELNDFMKPASLLPAHVST